MAVFVICWFTAVTLTVIFQCTPVRFSRNKNLPDSRCIDFETFIWKLQMPATKKSSGATSTANATH
jgi:hypothetical protein